MLWIFLAAFLFKEAKDLGIDEIEESKIKQCMQVKLKMLQTWLPLLCRASNGTDAPALSINERAGLERVLEGIIEELEQEKQEQVLSLWLHHFTHCSSSDWPNLHSCYARWCCKSRKQLLLLNENWYSYTSLYIHVEAKLQLSNCSFHSFQKCKKC
jgi:hypothetical protein